MPPRKTTGCSELEDTGGLKDNIGWEDNELDPYFEHMEHLPSFEPESGDSDSYGDE